MEILMMAMRMMMMVAQALEQPCLCSDYDNTIALDKHFYRTLTIRRMFPSLSLHNA